MIGVLPDDIRVLTSVELTNAATNSCRLGLRTSAGAGPVKPVQPTE